MKKQFSMSMYAGRDDMHKAMIEYIRELEAQIDSLNDKHEKEMTAELEERDHWHNKATELANDIADALGFDVGEHTSANCPVQEAIDYIYQNRKRIEELR